jgi:hypothetical protein
MATGAKLRETERHEIATLELARVDVKLLHRQRRKLCSLALCRGAD